MAFEVFARVVVIWEKIGVPDDERKKFQDMLSMPCAEVVRRLRQEERSLKDHMEHERQKVRVQASPARTDIGSREARCVDPCPSS